MKRVFTNNYGNMDSWMIEFESGVEVEKVMKFLEKGITENSLVDSEQTETNQEQEKEQENVGKNEEGN